MIHPGFPPKQGRLVKDGQYPRNVVVGVSASLQLSPRRSGSRDGLAVGRDTSHDAVLLARMNGGDGTVAGAAVRVCLKLSKK
jgi:hypothetical protein